MKRQKYVTLEEQDYLIPMQRTAQPKFENFLEAQIQEGDTLQALALRFHCTVADLKRINKIDKENEIYARKILKIPVTPHSILLETLPSVHKSGQSSPDRQEKTKTKSIDNSTELNEKLLVASVNSSEVLKDNFRTNSDELINTIILNSKVRNNNNILDGANIDDSTDTEREILLNNLIKDDDIPDPRMIPGPKSLFDWSGSDCDMSWICLFIFILALCVIIPLLYILYVTEHPEKFHHNSV